MQGPHPPNAPAPLPLSLRAGPVTRSSTRKNWPWRVSGSSTSLPMSQDPASLSPTGANSLLTVHGVGLLGALGRASPGRGLPQGAVPSEGLREGPGSWPPGSLFTGPRTGGLGAGAVWLCIRAGRSKERVGEWGTPQFTSHTHAAPCLRCRQQAVAFQGKRVV